MFEFLGNSRYKYLGENYPYTGKIFAKSVGSNKELVIGEWNNGKMILYNKSNSYEEEVDLQEGRLQMYNNDKTVFTEQKDFPLITIKDMYDEGSIVTNPDYQRDYVYNDKQASRLVESIIMGIPIPAVYFSEEDDGSLSVIDGQQRITSFVRYLKNEFRLNGLIELSSLNGKYFKDLDKTIQRKLLSSSLRAICLLNQSKELKYEIFARLNQGAVALKPQELRNCIYRGSFNNMLKNIAESNRLLPILFHDENNRKIYEERILRFFALRNFTSYKSSILKTMNSFMAEHQNDPEDKIQSYKNLFNGTIDIIKQVLGESAFFAYDRDKKEFMSKFSGSVYDSIIIPFSFFNKHDLIVHADKIREKINELKTMDAQYQEDTYAATGSRKRVIGRIMKVYNLLSKITGSYGNNNVNRLFSDEIKKELFYDGYICSYCNNRILSIDDCEVDHIIPFSQGGKTEISNAQLLHRHCNRAKSDSYDSLNIWEEE